MFKYYLYRLFLKAMGEDERIFISGNSKRSASIISCLQSYSMDNVHFNWLDKHSYNLVLHYDRQVQTEYAAMEDRTLFLFIGEDTNELDVAYTILSSYYGARRSADDNNSYLLCV